MLLSRRNDMPLDKKRTRKIRRIFDTCTSTLHVLNLTNECFKELEGLVDSDFGFAVSKILTQIAIDQGKCVPIDVPDCDLVVTPDC